MRVVRSLIAHGRIEEVETSEAQAIAGVAAVWTAADIAEIPTIDFRMTKVQSLDACRQPILAREFVRYVGEPVAVVFAESAHLAEDAAERVELKIAPLPPLHGNTDPVGEFLPGIDTEPAIIEKGYGELGRAFKNAAHVIEAEFVIGRHSGVPLETRGAIARFNREKNRLELHGAAKVPHANKTALAKLLGLPENGIELFQGHVGGGFGIRGELYPEDVLVCLAARRLHRPVRWIEERSEHLTCANHSRDQRHRIRAAVDETGFILGLDDEFYTDQGAYVRTHGATVTDLACALLPGPYVIPAYRARGHIRLTNKTPAGTYRAPGRYETTFVRERLIDLIADQLDLDSMAVRRINFIAPDEMPFERGIETIGTPVTYDSGNYQELLTHLIAYIDEPALQAELTSRRDAGKLVGCGLGYFVEKSGLGPYDDVRIEISSNGDIEVVTGAASIGQGVETAIAQVAAEGLGANIDQVRVTHGQTVRISRGMGAFASRVTVMTGAATAEAAAALKQTLLAEAAKRLQMPAGKLTAEDGRIYRTNAPDGPSIGLTEAAAACIGDQTSGDVVSAEATFETTHMTYPYGIHFVVVEVDRETALVRIERYVVAYDVGRAVNPTLVAGQIHGGVVQGIGGALEEEFVYNAALQPQSATFMDYVMPIAGEIPKIELVLREDAPSRTNPLGVKGAGEGGINAAGAAIASAIDQAIGKPGAIRELPITPSRLHALMKS